MKPVNNLGATTRRGETPEKCWGGKGTRRLCHGCAEAIAPEDVEYELDIDGGVTLLIDANCLSARNEEREERMNGSDAVPKWITLPL